MQNLGKDWLVLWKMTWGICRILAQHSKVLKMCTLMGSFWSNYMFELKHYRRVMCHDTEGWCNMTLKGDQKLTVGLKNDIRNLINFHESSCKSQNLHFDGLVLSRAFNILAEKVLKSYVSSHWRVIQKKLILEKYAFFVWCNRLDAVSGSYF